MPFPKAAQNRLRIFVIDAPETAFLTIFHRLIPPWLVDPDTNAVLPDAIVSVAEHVPKGGLWLSVALAISGPGQNCSEGVSALRGFSVITRIFSFILVTSKKVFYGDNFIYHGTSTVSTCDGSIYKMIDLTGRFIYLSDVLCCCGGDEKNNKRS